jgi:hypothetical protein
MKNLKLVLTLVVGITLAFYMGNVFATAFDRPELSTTIGVVLIALACIPKTKEAVAFNEASPDLSQIAKYAVANSKALIRRFYNGLRIADDITLQPNVKNKMPMPMLVINGQPRPYTGNHKANGGDISYTDRELSVDDFQRDISIDPSQYRNTYLAQLRGAGEGANNLTVPYAQFTMETIIGENASSLNNQTAFNGLGKAAFAAFNPATVYAKGAPVKFAGLDGEPHYYVALAATTAGESPATTPAKWLLADALAITEGIGTKIKAARGSGLLKNVAATGKTNVDDAFGQALAVYRKLLQGLRDSRNDIFLYGAPDLFDMVADSFGDNIQKYTAADGTLTVLPRTDGKCKIKRASWMAGSEMFIASPKSNLFMGTDLLNDLNELRVVPQVYKLDMGLKGLIGFQFADEQAIATNDQN